MGRVSAIADIFLFFCIFVFLFFLFDFLGLRLMEQCPQLEKNFVGFVAMRLAGLALAVGYIPVALQKFF